MIRSVPLAGVRYFLTFVALAGLLYYSNARLNEVASALDNRLFDMARLEEASRLQSEMTDFLNAARRFSQGDGAADRQGVSQAFDIVWSRVASLTSQSYASAIDPIDRDLSLDRLKAALPAYQSALDALRFGEAGSYRPLDALGQRFAASVAGIGDRAYVTRRKIMNAAIDRDITGFQRIKEVQREYFLTVAAFLIYVLVELALSRGTNRKLSRLVEDKQRVMLTDYLTGISNRRHFEEALRAAASRGPCCVVYFDLDGFKKVNDTFGHAVGDKLLGNVAQIMIGAKKEDDVVARFGGDEFGAVIHGPKPQARLFAARVIAEAASMLAIDGHAVQVSVSAGSCHTDDTSAAGESLPETLMRNADLALYEAKRLGKNQVRCFEPRLQAGHERRVALEKDMPRAIAEGRLYVVFQPVIRMEGMKVRAAEALVRWDHPVFGAIHPLEIVRTAESTNQILDMTCFVLDRACEMRAALSFVPAIFQLSVNISPRLLAIEGFAEVVRDTVSRWPVKPGMIVLEVTEDAISADDNHLAGNIARLKDYGFTLAVDDFGTGESNLSRLSELDFRVLKFDKSLLAKVETSSKDVRILQALCRMARDIGMLTVAEGVENERQLTILRDIGVGYLQGLHFSRPLNSLAFLKYVAENLNGVNAVAAIDAQGRRRPAA